MINYERVWNSFFEEKYDIGSNVSIPENEITVNMHDYFNQARDEMLAELNKGQEEAIKRYEVIRKELNRDIEDEDKLMAQLFANKFYLLVEIPRPFVSELQHLVVLDFYPKRGGNDLIRYLIV